MAESSVKFQGSGPFYIRTVEHAIATALANTVQLTLYAAVEEENPTLIQIETQMTPCAAQELASTLNRALSEADQATDKYAAGRLNVTP